MKNRIAKIIAVIAGVALITAGIGSSAYALTGNNEQNTEETVQEKAEKIVSDLIAGDTEDKPVKDETVYVIAGEDGSVKKIIVSDWLKNVTGSTELTDATGLDNIEEVKGDADHVYTMNGDNSRVWDAEGNDIYYRGNIEKELPVTVKISYRLDGNDISAEELKGRSGELTIRYEYENTQYEIKTINGNEEKVYVPFVMLTGMMLDNDTFTDVEVSNGKLINDGDRTFVIGAALPGLRENLGLEDGKMAEISDGFEIRAHVNDYEPAMVVSVATNELFNKINTEKLDLADGLGDSMNELTNAVAQLIDGSSQLYDGLDTLLEKSGELANGIDALAEGSRQLKDGAAKLDAGAGKLKDGAEALSSGLDTLKANNGALNGGAKQVFESLLATARTQLQAAGIDVPEFTIDNYAQVLDGIIASLDEDAVYKKAAEAVRTAVEEKRDYIESQVTEAVKVQVAEGVKAAVEEQVTAKVEAAVKASTVDRIKVAAPGMDDSVYEAMAAEKMGTDEVKTLVASTVDVQMGSDEVATAIESNIEAKMASEDIRAIIKKNTDDQVEKLVAENMESDEVKAKLAEASEGAAKIISLKSSLDSYNTFYKGLASYTDGVAQAAAGASELNNGAAQLKDGSASLSSGSTALNAGLETVQSNMPALIDGVTQLRDGAGALNEGMNQFNEQGVEKLVDAVDGDLEGLVERFKAVVEVSKEYKSFSGLSDEMDGDVKFIYRIGE